MERVGKGERGKRGWMEGVVGWMKEGVVGWMKEGVVGWMKGVVGWMEGVVGWMKDEGWVEEEGWRKKKEGGGWRRYNTKLHRHPAEKGTVKSLALPA